MLDEKYRCKKISAWNRGISPVVATVIVVAVTIAIAVAVAFWISGILGATGYGTRPVKLAIYSDLEIYGEYFVILVKNLGSDTVFIDRLYVDEKPVTYIFDAQTYPPPGEPRWIHEEGERVIVYINPGETVQIKGVTGNISLDPGVTHEVTIHTAQGFEFHRVLHSRIISPISFPTGGIKAYDTGLKDPNNPSKKIILIYLKIKNNWDEDLYINRVELYDPDTRQLLGNVDVSPPITIAPGESWTPQRLRDLIKVGMNPGKYIINVTWKCGNRGGGLAAYLEVSSKPLKIYVIDIEGDRSKFIDKVLAYQITRQYADVEVISTREQLYEFFNNPPEKNVIVINFHGIVFPIPGYNDISGQPGLFVKVPPADSTGNWENDLEVTYIGGTKVPYWSYFIGESVAENGLILVGTGGTFEYYVNNDYKDTWKSPESSFIDTGINGLWGVLHITSGVIQEGIGKIIVGNYTELVSDIAWLFEDDSIKVNKTPIRTAVYDVFYNSLPADSYYVFYTTNYSTYPVSSIAIRRGQGFVIFNGWVYPGSYRWQYTVPPLNSEEDATRFYTKISIYEAIYVYLMEYVIGG